MTSVYVYMQIYWTLDQCVLCVPSGCRMLCCTFVEEVFSCKWFLLMICPSNVSFYNWYNWWLQLFITNFLLSWALRHWYIWCSIVFGLGRIWCCRISSIITAFLITTPVRYYLNTNNIDIVVIFISISLSNSTACHFATPGIMANYCVTMIISLIVFDL